jgi:hypothetical protein
LGQRNQADYSIRINTEGLISPRIPSLSKKMHIPA